MNLNAYTNRRGIATLIVIIIVSAVILLIAMSATLKGIDETQTGAHQNKSLEIFSGTDGCLDEGLLGLNNSSSYTGEVLTLGNISCIIVVTGHGSTRTINVVATYGTDYDREIEAVVTLSPEFVITSWSEITD
ncbi:MAG: hypothetical protein Q8P68_05275 [Candidatus Peregrinibacteria bacterium]|nr:hypothetical protein [Candidatus Peregrinibacteria bacterium]MDZ4244396.1 hypothetical protein [Candidatus Gracilibacteria bacterium]